MLTSLEASSAPCKLMKLSFIDAHGGKKRAHAKHFSCQGTFYYVEWKNDTQRESNYVIYMFREE